MATEVERLLHHSLADEFNEDDICCYSASNACNDVDFARRFAETWLVRKPELTRELPFSDIVCKL